MDVYDLEQKRLLALQRFGLLDTPPEAIFDGISVAIANICEVPIALVSLVDVDRQWFKSAYGLQAKETPRDVAFCSHAIERPDELMIVEDAAIDERFHNNPLVVGDPNIRFYAGKPIVTDDGYALGTLCVIDRKPKQLSPYQLDALEALTKTVSAILDERYRLQKTAIDRDALEELLHDRAKKYHHLYEDTASMLHGVLQQLPSAAIAIGSKGEIVSYNDAWNGFASTVGWSNTAAGCNFLDACADASAPFSDGKQALQAALVDVLSGDLKEFQFEYDGAVGKCLIDIVSTAKTRGAKSAIVQLYASTPH